MHIEVNGTRLFFESVGTTLRMDDPPGRERPPLIVLHGGPGFDHTGLRNYFDRFADAVQVIYLDQRGNGRSARSNPELWTLEQWGDDVRAFAAALGLVRPIVFGNSFGGFVAQAYAIANPGHARGLILSSTSAHLDMAAWARRIEDCAGAEARAIAEAFWLEGGDEATARFAQKVLPLYMTPGDDRDRLAARHLIRRADAAHHFYGSKGESRRFDFRPALKAITCPTLVLSGGDGDLTTPPESARELARGIGSHCELEIFSGAKHGAFRDELQAFDGAMRRFFARLEA